MRMISMRKNRTKTRLKLRMKGLNKKLMIKTAIRKRCKKTKISPGTKRTLCLLISADQKPATSYRTLTKGYAKMMSTVRWSQRPRR